MIYFVEEGVAGAQVTKEFVNATKEVAAGQPAGAGASAVAREGSDGSDDGSDDGSERGGEAEGEEEEEGSEDDMTERQMEAMLDAELGGFGEELDDDLLKKCEHVKNVVKSLG